MRNMVLFEADEDFLEFRKNLKILRPHHDMIIRKIIITKLN